MNPAKEIFDAGFERSIFLNRNRERLVNQAIRLASNIEKEAVGAILAAVGRLSGADVVRLQNGLHRATARLRRLDDLVLRYLRKTERELKKILGEDFRKLAVSEAQYWQKIIGQITTEIPALGEAITNNQPNFTETKKDSVAGVLFGATLAGSLLAWRQGRRGQVRGVIADGARDNGILGIIQALRVTKTDRGRGRLIGGSSATLGGKVRSYHNKSVRVGVEKFCGANDNAMDLVVIAVLDDKTSSTCWDNHGRRVGLPRSENGTGGEVPPFHINCRTIVIPIILFNQIADEVRDKLTDETKEALKNPIPDAATAGEVFEQLSESRQRNILGPRKFELWQENRRRLKYPKDFINPKTQKFWTIEQINERLGIAA